MAKVRFGPLAGAISGSQGNTTWSRNRYGPYLRVRTIPTKVVSPYTTVVRGRLAALSQAYQTLTAAQRAAWATWAEDHRVIDRLGDSQVLQASDAFIQLNMRIDALGGSQISIPPIAAPPAAVEGLAVVASDAADSVDVSWTSGALGANECLAVWVAVVTSAGRNYYKNLLKLVYYSPAAAISPQSAGASVVARFGDVIQGQKIFVHAFVYDKTTGLSSALAVANCVVGA